MAGAALALGPVAAAVEAAADPGSLAWTDTGGAAACPPVRALPLLLHCHALRMCCGVRSRRATLGLVAQRLAVHAQAGPAAAVEGAGDT